MTPLEKFALNILEARDGRQDALARALSQGRPAILFLSLNIPGQEKTPPGSEALFFWMLEELNNEFSGLVVLENVHDALGPYAVMSLDLDPYDVKRRCIAAETKYPFARLIDLDVYSPEGVQIDRGRLGLPRRPCLVCSRPAVECIRLKRHSYEEVVAKVHELLARFRT
ncbi:citrate lyase holo-[acyl-carrier protein] synthase [Propionivibrio limicola]|uniref:citrate lyase holo-[acyl-carrier protein] synthase n=1 Tax=Propionivibrio limicola TaxID=167645 RepID=UPI0014786354|nr:citrate lyase holo-[acyl-carrier protein] synthase [Propionivibrio limicola]